MTDGGSTGPLELGAELVRQARRRRRLSQRELARRSGIPQSTISVIESGRQQPTTGTLARLVEAAGLRIDARLVNAVRPAQLLADHREAVMDLLARHFVRRAWVFGSVGRGTDGPDSDLDLLVEFEEGSPFVEQVRLGDELTELLGCRVDLVATSELKSNELFRRRVMRDRKQLEVA